MAKRLFTSGNYIVADKDDTTPLLYFPKSQAAFWKDANSYDLTAFASGTSGGSYLAILITDIGNWYDEAGTTAYTDATLVKYLTSITGSGSSGSNSVSENETGNSSILPLASAAVFTGGGEDVSAYDSVVVAVKTDQYGSFSVQFSTDNVNWDSTLTRYYRTNQIEAPHRFTITRKYCRVVFTNDSGSAQTYFRLQTTFGTKSDLNAPLDSTLSQDFDSTAVRPSDFNTECAIGLRQGHEVWNKFGYNDDVDVGTEIIASWGGAMTITTTAYTLSVVSTDVADDDGGTGCNSIVIYGIDENRDEQTVVLTMNGTTPVVTAETWLGVNRVVMFLCGTGQVNAGTITATLTTAGTIMAQMPLGGGVTQQCIFYVPEKHNFIAEWVRVNAVNKGKAAILTIKMWVWSAVSNGKQEVYRERIDTDSNPDVSENPRIPFPITEKTVVWLEATSDKADVEVSARFSGMLIRDKDSIAS